MPFFLYPHLHTHLDYYIYLLAEGSLVSIRNRCDILGKGVFLLEDVVFQSFDPQITWFVTNEPSFFSIMYGKSFSVFVSWSVLDLRLLELYALDFLNLWPPSPGAVCSVLGFMTDACVIYSYRIVRLSIGDFLSFLQWGECHLMYCRVCAWYQLQ